MAIPQHFIQELLARADVVEIVGRYVQLKKTGANFSGLCPFHSEKSPSFTVSPSKQFYHCFGCGKNGNAIGFLMDHTGAGFVEVVHDLAQQYGMTVPEDERSPVERARAAQQSEKRATLTDVLARAGEAYRRHLKDSPRAIGYLKQRGLSGQVARDFGLGYAPEGWRTLASVFPDYTDPLLQESGLVIVSEDPSTSPGQAPATNPGQTPATSPGQATPTSPGQATPTSPGARRYDRFRDRVMFPIRSVKGEVIGFGGRVLGDEKPKYLNSPETPVFHKGRELYGLFEARAALREHGYALVTEGYMDVVALAQLGFANAVATLGTACTPEHVQKLFRFTDSIVFSFDGDAAGRRAAHKALEAALPFATDLRMVKFLFLPAEHDPDSFIRAEGTEAFAQAVEKALPLSHFLLDAAAEECDMDTPEGRAHFAARAQPLWQLLPRGALARQLLGEIAARVQIGVHELEQLWGLRRPVAASPSGPASAPRRRAGAERPVSRTPTRSAPRPRTPPASRASRALQILLTDSAAWDHLSQADQALLCDLPAPHGPLFTWLAGQALDHGPQPWSALREALRDHELEPVAVQLVESLPLDIESDTAELNHILALEHDARYAAERERLVAAAADGDRAAYERLKTLPTQRPR